MSRGVPLPPWGHKTANRALAIILQRERDLEMAKADYMVQTLAVVHGIDKSVFEAKTKILKDVRDSLKSLVYQDSYNPIVQRARKIQQEQELLREKKALETVASLGKKGG